MMLFYEETEEKAYTADQLDRYKKYVQEWKYRVRCDRNGFVPWGISNHQGDPWDIENWLERTYLHNFPGTDY